jgi:hypothetical protein
METNTDTAAASHEIVPFKRLTLTSPSAENPVLQSPSLMSLDPADRYTIFKYHFGFSGPDDLPSLHICDFAYAVPIEDVEVHSDPEKDTWDRHVNFSLHIDRVLPLYPEINLVTSRNRMQAVYGEKIPELSVSVRVIQQIEFQSPSNLLNGILNLPGINTASQLLVPYIEGHEVTSMTLQTPSTLAHTLAKFNHSPHPHSKYIHTFAVINHANIFAWQRFTALDLENLTIRMLGTELWGRYSFIPTIHHFALLPVIAVLTSIITNKSYGMKKITLAGLGPFKKFFKGMWDAIPQSTPITGINLLLDVLVAFPFSGGDRLALLHQLVVNGEGDSEMRAREGSLWGLRSSMQWQAIIMKVRWSKNQPQFKFKGKAWGYWRK